MLFPMGDFFKRNNIDPSDESWRISVEIVLSTTLSDTYNLARLSSSTTVPSCNQAFYAGNGGTRHTLLSRARTIGANDSPDDIIVASESPVKLRDL